MMRNKVKSSLIIIITLIIGIAIGFEISEINIRHKFERMDAFRRPDGFLKIFDGIIQPDSNQKPVVDSILTSYHKRIETITKTGMEQISNYIDSMNAALKPILNNSQRNNLDKEMLRMKKHEPPPPPGK
jgi:hypothetical protein